MKKDFVLPILVLRVICLLITGALAVTNNFTEPVITAAAAERAAAARQEILPKAGGFELMQLDGLPATVKEIYKTTNNAGYFFLLTASGYGGELKIICAIDSDGFIVGSKTLEQSETKGLGTKSIDKIESSIAGADSTLSGVDGVSGATITAKAYLGAVHDAFTAFEIAKEAAK